MLIQALQWLSALAVEFWALVRPGGVSYELHWVNFIASNGHYVLEACLVGVILALILQKGRPSGREEPLTEKVQV
jgi:hypothetical protein